MKYILFYTVNGLGLGHLVRSLAIARQIRKQNPELIPLFFTASEGANLLFQEGFAYYKVPSKTLARENKLLKRNLALSYTQILTSLVNTYRPVALVVDTFPLGSLQELLAILNLPLRWQKFFIHREQQHMTPEKIATQAFYDWIIAPHSSNTAHIPVPNKNKLFWSNEILIREKFELQSKENARLRLGLQTNQNLLLLSLGGGGDRTTIDNYHQILALLPQHYKIVIPDAPLANLKQELNNHRKDNIEFITHFPLMELMPAFDSAISAAGYNTFHELLTCDVPSIFIPKTRGYDDQHKRAYTAQHMNAAFVVEEQDISTNLIGSLEKLEQVSQHSSFKPSSLVPTDGATLAARFILEKLS